MVVIVLRAAAAAVVLVKVPVRVGMVVRMVVVAAVEKNLILVALVAMVLVYSPIRLAAQPHLRPLRQITT
jgi:hypothetical protein